MTTQTTSLFVYGTLKRGHRLNSVLGGGSTLIHPAVTVLNDFDLHGYGLAFPIMSFTEDSQGYKIIGELYTVTPSVMDRVNAIETNAGYVPFIIDVKPFDNSGSVEQAIVFIYPSTDKYMKLAEIKSSTIGGVTGQVKGWA